jgi:hypothetical protein
MLESPGENRTPVFRNGSGERSHQTGKKRAVKLSSIWEPSSACLDLMRLSMSSHLLGCIKEQMAIPLVYAAEEPSQLHIKLAVLPRYSVWPIEITTAKDRSCWLIAFVANFPERHVECGGELLQSLNARNRVAIFESGDVTTNEAGAFFDVALAQLFQFSELT